MSRSLLLIIIVLAIICGWYLCHRLFPPLREGLSGGGVYSPSHTDIRRTADIDNRKWVDNSRHINKHNWEDNRTQTLTQNDPRLFSSMARIDNPDEGSVFYPGSTFIVFGKGKNKRGGGKKRRNPLDILPPQHSKKRNHSHFDAWASPRQHENKRTNNMFSAFSQQEVEGEFQNTGHFDEVSASEGKGKPFAFNNDIYVKHL